MKEKKKKKKSFLYFWFELEREEWSESELSKLLSIIYGDRLVEIHWTKNESSFTRRELRVGTEITGFR